MHRAVYKPEDAAYLKRRQTKGYKVQDSAFMLQYARGRIPSMLRFGLANTVFSTVDSRTFWETIGINGNLIFSELLKGKV